MDGRGCFDCRQTSITRGTPDRTCVGFLLMSAALFVGFCQSSLAQTYPPREELPAPASPNVPAPHGGPLPAQRSAIQNGRISDHIGLPRVVDHRNLSDIIRDTAAARRRTTDQLKAHAPQLSPAHEANDGNEPSEYGHPFGELRDRMSQSRDDLTTTNNRLDEKLDLLEGILENNPACQPQPVAADAQPSTLEPLQDAPARRHDPTPITDAPSNTDQQLTVPTLQSPPETPIAIAQPIVDAIAVTNEPVDQMSLANNLYATREHELALQIYQKINVDDLSTRDAVWTRYQIANCQQQLGNLPAAQRGFRQVTNATDGGWWSKNGHWWLDTNDKTARLRKRLDQLEHKLSELKGASNDDTPRQ